MFDVLCFLETPTLRFALLSYYRRIQRFIIVIFHRQLLIFLTTLIQIARILKKYLNQRHLKRPIVCRQLIIPLHRCLRGLQCTSKKMFLPAAINNKISTRIYSSIFWLLVYLPRHWNTGLMSSWDWTDQLTEVDKLWW